jgi:hypothetical protein
VFGLTVVAVITLLLGVYGLSRRDVADLARDMFGLPISVGGVVGYQKIGAARSRRAARREGTRSGIGGARGGQRPATCRGLSASPPALPS